MANVSKWMLIGKGQIGGGVIYQLSNKVVADRLGLESKPHYIVTRNEVLDSDDTVVLSSNDISKLADIPEYVFVAIPSTNDGVEAYGYIAPLLKQGKTVITAEKGAMSNYFGELRDLSDDFRTLGINATVGGGTRILRLAQEYCHDIDNIAEIHLSLNGTLAAILSWVSPLSGESLNVAEAVSRAVKEGYAEPGSTSAVDVIRSEAEGDIPKKLSIFFNVLRLGKPLDWHDLRFTLKSAEIERALDPTKPTRFIVSLYPPSHGSALSKDEEDAIIGGFRVEHDGWRLVGGFRRVDVSSDQDQSSEKVYAALGKSLGPTNGMILALGPDKGYENVYHEDGVYSVTGPGAGVPPTVNTMLDDYLRLRTQR